MSSIKYPVGTRLVLDEKHGHAVTGVVVENRKLPGDVCVVWHLWGDRTMHSSYDEWWLDENAKKIVD